jgi:hypothetical protein
MPSIQSHQELLEHLAKNGDPSAFYTLTAPYAHSTYVSLRNAGKSHTEAMSILGPFLKKIYQDYMVNIESATFESWYEAHLAKDLAAFSDFKKNALGTTVPDTVPPKDISHFESQIRLVFQRNYSKALRAKNRLVYRQGVSYINSHVFLKFGLITVLFLILLAALFISLTVAHIDVSISISSGAATRTLSLPSAVNHLLFPQKAIQKPSVNTANAVIDSSRVQSVHRDSIHLGGTPAEEKTLPKTMQTRGLMRTGRTAKQSPDFINNNIPKRRLQTRRQPTQSEEEKSPPPTDNIPGLQEKSRDSSIESTTVSP